MKLEDLKDEDRTLVVVALKSLHRERITSWNAAVTACSLAGKTAPSADTLVLMTSLTRNVVMVLHLSDKSDIAPVR